MSAPRPRPGTQKEEVPGTGECVLLDARRARVLALNPAAAAVWDLLDGRREPAELAAILAGAAGIPPAQAEADVRALLLRLGSEGFLSEEERGSSP